MIEQDDFFTGQNFKQLGEEEVSLRASSCETYFLNQPLLQAVAVAVAVDLNRQCYLSCLMSHKLELVSSLDLMASFGCLR